MQVKVLFLLEVNLKSQIEIILLYFSFLNNFAQKLGRSCCLGKLMQDARFYKKPQGRLWWAKEVMLPDCIPCLTKTS